MAMCAISIIPLIWQLSNEAVVQEWYWWCASVVADHRTIRCGVINLYTIPQILTHCKDAKLPQYFKVWYLNYQWGNVILVLRKGLNYMSIPMSMEWITGTELLSRILIAQPYSADAAFTHCLSSKWTFLSWKIPNIQPLLQPLKYTICMSFLPHLTGQNTFSFLLRDVLALPTQLGGLGIVKLNWSISHSALQPCSSDFLWTSMKQLTSLPFEAIDPQSTSNTWR